MNESTMRALQLVREGRPQGLRRDEVTALQSAGLVQRLDGQLRLTSKGAAIVAGTPSGLWSGQGLASPDADG